MSGLESEAVKVEQFFLSAIIDKIKTYVDYIKKCEENLGLLRKDLKTLRAEMDDIDEKVLRGKENSEKVTAKATLWLARVKELVNDESLKTLMNKEMGIAKVVLRLMKNNLRELVEEDGGGEMLDVAVKVMKDIEKRKKKAGSRPEVSNVDEKDEEVCQVLEKLIEETMGEFKKLMQNDEKMAIAAMHLLENHKEKLEKLTEKDKEMADIIAKARKTSKDAELLSDNHDDENVVKDNVVENVNTLKVKVKDLLKPVGNLIMNEEVLKTLPENVRLGMEAIDVVIGNRRGLKTELMDPENGASHRNSCCCCVISCNFFSDRYHMSVAAKDMLDKIKDIIRTKPGSEDVTRPTRRGEMDDIPTNSVGLKSRNELLQKIIKALESSDVHAVGVFGMGRSGKTTLAKEVFNSKAEGTFKTAVMVEISESPNIEYIQDQIGDGLGLGLHNVHGIHEKAVRLYNQLKTEGEGGRNDNNAKKILIVLDNIWKKIDLVQMGIPQEYCKLLVTSREREVCKAMDVQEVNIFEVGLLNKDEEKDLFKFQVQKEVTGEYNIVADRLLKKCGGLPLSIVATTNSLKGKELPFWRQFVDELEKPISCQIPGVRYDTFSILRTSYEVMASEEKKKFFLLACLSPIGSSISIDNLMRYGIGLDLFQHVNKLSEAIDLARTWAEELVSSSMLLKGDSEEYVKIHDVVRESTMSFASKSGINTDGQMFLVDAIPRWICEETFNKYTGISLLAQANFARLSGVKANLLQILLLKGNRNQDSFLESNFFQGMTNLKVLEVLFINFEKGLPESMGKLKVLQTLHLVECKIGDIKLIGELGSLLVLSLRGSSLEGLPDEIGELDKLRLLDMTSCECKEPRIPANVIARLSLLEGVYAVDRSLSPWSYMESTSYDTEVIRADMDEFNKLKFLNVLEIRMLVSLPIGAQFVENLDKFQVIVGRSYFKLKPSQRALIVSNFDVSQELKKDNCLKALLKKADYLALYSAKVNNIVPELDKEGYRDLTHLQLSNIDSISRICEGKAPRELFYNLCHLKVSTLMKLKELLPVNPLPRKITTLEISECNSLTYIFSEDDGVNKESDIIELPCLKKLKLDWVFNLISMVKQSNNDDSQHPSFFNSKVTLTSLEELSLRNNARIVKLWDKEPPNLPSFQHLKVLKIDRCSKMETIGPPSMFLCLLQLESLRIDNCEKIQVVTSDENERQEESHEQIITFPNLQHLEIYSSENLKCFYDGSYKIAFPRLKVLTLCYVERMTKFAGDESSTALFPKTVTLTSLEELALRCNARIVKLWDKEPHNLDSFQHLKVLNIEGCSKMETIGPTSMFLCLVQLESLRIENCKKMQQVISDENERQEESHEQIITFPNLKDLQILSSENLKCFYGGSYKMAFPRLEELTLCFLKRMTKFARDESSTALFSQNEELRLLKPSDEVRVLWDLHEGDGQGISSNPIPNLKELHIWKIELSSIVFPSLSFLKVEAVGDAKFLFSSSENEGCLGTFSQFPKLEALDLEGCPGSVKQFIEDDGSTAMLNFCGQLRSLKFQSALNMEATCLHPFKSLRDLSISDLTCEYLFSADGGFEQFQSLEELTIEHCPDLELIIRGGDKDKAFVFPRLKILRLWNLQRMTKLCSISDIPFQFPSLVHLDIYWCNKLESLFCGEPNQVVELPSLEAVTIREFDAMKSFSTRPLKAPKLRYLTVSNCPEMEWFLLGNSNCNADLELPSLENVTIEKCPNMKSFSPAVLRAPKLQRVTVDDKPYSIAEIEDLNHVLKSANSSEQTCS